MPITRLDRVYSDDMEARRGMEAWRDSLEVVRIVREKLRSSLGPAGGYKMITYSRGPQQVVKVTKDAVEISEELGIDSPPSKILAEAAKVQRWQIGDGVCSCILLACELIDGALELAALEVHPGLILAGYDKALQKALETVESSSFMPDGDGMAASVRSACSGRAWVTDDVAAKVVDACRFSTVDGRLDEERIGTLTKRGSGADSELIDGFVLDAAKLYPSHPAVVPGPRVALVSPWLGVKRVETKMKGEGRFQMRVQIGDPSKLRRLRDEIHSMNMEYVDALASTGANVVVCRQWISEDIRGELARRGIFQINDVGEQRMRAASKALRGEVVGSLDDLRNAELGFADKLEVIRYGPEDAVVFRGCASSTLLFRGSASQVLDESQRVGRSLITVAKNSLEDPRMVLGGGSAEMRVSRGVRLSALKHPGREQLAIERFADAVEAIPTYLAENFGLDAVTTLSELRSLHANGFEAFGVSAEGCADMSKNRVFDMTRVKRSLLRRAVEVARLMIRVDSTFMTSAIPKFHKR